MSLDQLIPLLLTIAWLAPLAGMIVSWSAGRLAIDRTSCLSAWIAIAAMVVSLTLAILVMVAWWLVPPGMMSQPIGGGGVTFYTPYSELFVSSPISGSYYTLGTFGDLSLTTGYYIDSLTVLLFFMITLIATAVHVYSAAYMHEGLPDDDLEDAIEAAAHENGGVNVEQDAQPSTRNPQLPRYFAQMQFFTFAMLGLVLAGNLLQVFVFWELVGIASYLLIGFHFERPHAAVASSKAFIMNRIGDAGFLIGMMILWTAFGTMQFGSQIELIYRHLGSGEIHDVSEIIQGDDYNISKSVVPGMITWAHSAKSSVAAMETLDFPHWWLVAAGLCLFAGCVGKSAQLPLSTWLPDAMAGPTPVSALVHSATMVAAGVYLVARLYPLFLPEVLIVIAYVGAITLVYGATCAIVQTDLKRILAYSTISQLGYMMLALGVGGREAGLFHLVTHAFFKSLLFLAAGSVIVACHHVQDLSQMGGLRKKMPLTAYTSLVGVIAIAGLSIPFFEPFGETIAFSGYHSKDSILAAALHFTQDHPAHFLLYWLPLLTAGLTAFYMFRFWWLAFAGTPRDGHLYDHARESSPWMTAPLVILAIFAAFAAVGGIEGPLFAMLDRHQPSFQSVFKDVEEVMAFQRLPVAHSATILFGHVLVLAGAITACLYYGLRDHLGKNRIKPAELSSSPRRLVIAGWMLDSLYDRLIVRPIYALSSAAAWCDRNLLDGIVHGSSRFVLAVARLDRLIDEKLLDGFVNRIATVTYAAGQGLRTVQTGRLRQYVVALAVATIALFALAIIIVPRIL